MIKTFIAIIMASTLLTSYGYAQDTTEATLLVVGRPTPIRNAIRERATKRIDRRKDRLNRRATTIRATTSYTAYTIDRAGDANALTELH